MLRRMCHLRITALQPPILLWPPALIHRGAFHYATRGCDRAQHDSSSAHNRCSVRKAGQQSGYKIASSAMPRQAVPDSALALSTREPGDSFPYKCPHELAITKVRAQTLSNLFVRPPSCACALRITPKVQ